MPPTTLKAVWTDFGGVLTPPVQHTFAAFCAKTGVEPEPLRRAISKVTAGYGTDDMMLPLDTPLVTEETWLRQVSRALTEEGVDLKLTSLADTWFDGREANNEWVDELYRAQALGIFVGLLTNMPPAWDAHWRRMVPPEPLFADVVSSAEVGHRKPDQAIFDLAAKRVGLEPAECVLVDDLAKNCAGAEAAGWRAIHFTDTATAKRELELLLGG